MPTPELIFKRSRSVSTRPEFMPGERNARWLPVAMERAMTPKSRDLRLA